MNTHETPRDRPEQQHAGAAHAERQFARRIDCAPRPHPAERVDRIAEPQPPRDDAHP
jgi:hypothetical protein